MGGNVGTVPVDVYVAMRVCAAAGTRLIEGGYGPAAAMSDGSIAPAPGPPVCQARYGPSNGLTGDPMAAHVPMAERGSAGT